ncbi:MAG: pro-sigmaK processing inhibitor BofA family protein [Clostridia bacterium]
MEYIVFFACVIASLILLKIFSFPAKVLFKFIFNILIGLVLLLVINTYCGGFNIHIPFNMVTAGISGILGVPGVILLVILQFFI